MSDLLCPGLSLCLLLTARLAAILASSLSGPGRVSWAADPHHLNPHCRVTPIIRDRCRVSRIPRTLGHSSNNMFLAFPAEIGFDSPLTYTVAPPSAQSEVFPRTSAPPST